MNEYKKFLSKNFPSIVLYEQYVDVYKVICKNNILTEIYIKYMSKKINCLDKTIFLNRYAIGLNKILIYLPLNDAIGINACMRYAVEQFLKFIYSNCTNIDVKKINETSYRHIKEDLKKRNANIRIYNEDLIRLYSYYANYSNDVHDKRVSLDEEIIFLQSILSDKNNYIKKVYDDIVNITKLFDKMMINLFEIQERMLSMSERLRIKSSIGNKQFDNILKMMQ